MNRLTGALKPVLKPALLLFGLTGGALALHLLPFGTVLKSHAQGHTGIADAVVLVALGTLACAVGVPRQIVAFAAGYAWGAAEGAALALLAQSLGCAADLFWARSIARNFVQARIRGRALQLDRLLTKTPFFTALTLRLMPVGNNLLLNLLAGVSAVPARGFLLGSVVGFIPQTIIFALIGAGSRIARGTQIEIGAGLFMLSTLIGLAMLRRSRGVAREVARSGGLAP